MAERRAVAAVEFAMVSFPFFLLLFFIFEISIDLFQQEALDAGLHLAVRQLQTGNAQNVTNGTAFINSYLCPNLSSTLGCSGLYVKVQKLTLSSGTSVSGGAYLIQGGYTDYYSSTTGLLPMTGGSLDLSTYASANFCNAGPSVFLLVSAVYVTNGIIGNFMPQVLTVAYNGSQMRAVLSQVATVTENYPASASNGSAAAQC